MSCSDGRLYELLPAFHRLADAQRGYPLRALLRVISEQAGLVEDDIAQLYENWFIETCEDWVVPYIADLIGSQPRNGPPSARREVALTLGFRRRKGTLALLGDLALAVTGWPARAVEFYRLLGWTQHLNHVHPHRAQTADLRRSELLDLLGGPFDRQAYTSGRRTIPDVGVYLWRLKSYPVTHTPACCLDSVGPHCFTFNPLGHDTRLFTNPVPEPEPGGPPDEINLPVPIRRLAFERRLSTHPLTARASDAYYGIGRSLVIWAPDWPRKGATQPVPAELVIPADLSGWHYRAHRDQLGADPVLGRIVFPAAQLPRHGVWVSYGYGFSADMGCGEYHRTLTAPASAAYYQVSKDNPAPGTLDAIGEALTRWRQDQEALGPEPADPAAKERWEQEHARLRAAVIEIGDSSVYRESLTVSLGAGESLQIRGADRTRPIIELAASESSRSTAFAVWGKAGSRLCLDGLVITGGPVQVNGPDPADAERLAQGDICDVRIRHATLVPGWALECNCDPRWPAEPSLELIGSTAKITVDHSIIGSIEVARDEYPADPASILITDSIVDATASGLSAVGGPDVLAAFARLTVTRSTVIGRVSADSIALAENSIFTGEVRVARRQAGCMRFCYVAWPVRTPRRYHCQPDLVTAADQATAAGEAQRVEPVFTSLRYGTPGYCQLAGDCAPEITGGADDESEMGAFHDLFQPQRTARLRARLDEYTVAGMNAEIIPAS
jgi:hypothetical protein